MLLQEDDLIKNLCMEITDNDQLLFWIQNKITVNIPTKAIFQNLILFLMAKKNYTPPKREEQKMATLNGN